MVELFAVFNDFHPEEHTSERECCDQIAHQAAVVYYSARR